METVIETFYKAFSALDAETMVACYHADIVFHDPAFGTLHGETAKNMWRMLCGSQKGKDFKIVFSDVVSDGSMGKAHWEAFYTFSKTGRKVHNIIDAAFVLRDGKIIEHRDHFDLYRWAGQAMGITGWMLGWTGFFKQKLQAQAQGMLERFMQARA